MKVTKTRTYVEISCDFCGTFEKNAFIEECSICKKDVCRSCAYVITKGFNGEIAFLCPECFKKLGINEVKDE